MLAFRFTTESCLRSSPLMAPSSLAVSLLWRPEARATLATRLQA